LFLDPTGALPTDPVIGSRSTRSPCVSTPNFLTWRRPCPNQHCQRAECSTLCRRLTEYRHHIHQHHHYEQQQQHHQPPPQELPPGASATGSVSGAALGPPIVFNPPGVDWQRAQADALRLAVHYPLPAPPSPGNVSSFATNVPPRRCRPVAGDGNCLFRALSWWITGSEEQHLEVSPSVEINLLLTGA